MTWTDRKVLVTGADGFVGSHLTDELVYRGARVTAVVRRTSRSQVTNTFRNLSPATVRQLDRVLHVDLAGPSAVAELTACEAEVWFHLAADAYVPASFNQPAAVVAANVMSTLNVLDAARTTRLAHLVVTSSSEVYGSHDEAITEEHPLRPATPYAASKVGCDRLAWSYHNSFDTPLTIVRPFNCYGPRHVYDVVPLFLARALRGDPLTVHGSGHQTRDLTYVSDTVDAFLRLAELPPAGEVFNIGTGIDHRIIDLARTIVELTNSDSEVRLGPPRVGEVRKLLGDASKLRAATGWTPRHDLAAGLEENVKWARENLAWL
ncbi:dTDP-glucose 4,6-dehydratase [Micromonospora sp. DT46]|uniref:dTDP-glucose 4,6-dehydratase n=1 Tax=Micromonospora sp. DT46 TaxID=3393435 RepID=UPI003CF98549